MAQKTLGLDLGAHSVKAVVLDGAFRGAGVAAFETARVPPTPEGGDPLDALKAALGELSQKLGGFKAELSAVAVPGSQAATPLLTLPFVDAKKVEATLGFEVEGLIPFDVEEVVYDHQLLAQRDGKSELAIGVARREDVTRLLGMLLSAGLDPRVITLPALAYQPLLQAISDQRSLGADEAVAILDLGHERCSLVVAGGTGASGAPVLLFARTFAGGGADLTRALSREFGVSDAEAEAWKEKEGDVSEAAADPRAQAALVRGVQPLVREVRSSLRAAQARSRRTVSAIHVCGGTSKLRGLPELLARDLGVQVLPLRPIVGPGPGPSEEALPLLPLGLGLAMRAQARGGKLLNLRKGELAYKGDLDYLKGKVSRLVAFAAVLVLLVGTNAWARSFTLKKQEKALDDQLCKVTTKILKTCEKDFTLAVSKLQGGDTKASQIPTASAIEIFVEANRQMPADVPLRMQEMDLTLQRLRLKGVVDSFDGVDQVVAGLKKSSCFGEVKRGRVQKNKEEKIEFTLEAEYTCGQNADKAG